MVRATLRAVAVTCGVFAVAAIFAAIWTTGGYWPYRLFCTAFVLAAISAFTAVGGWAA
jgi:hypothetical protein